MSPVVRLLITLSFTLLLLLTTQSAWSAEDNVGDIVVVNMKGDVSINGGSGRALRAGSVLVLPATVRTGVDGAIELRQGTTTVSVGPDTLLEFPAIEKPGAPIDRIVQPRGNVFYNIGKRTGRKLRVETPYLVGVVKGTQFSVAASDQGTTISLFEGLLEVRTADDGDVVDLRAGEIATRKLDDQSISVLQMKGAKSPPASRPQSGADVLAQVDPSAGVEAAGELGNVADVSASTAVDPIASIDSAANVTVDAGPAPVEVVGGASVDPALPAAIASDDPGTATGAGVLAQVDPSAGVEAAGELGNVADVSASTAADTIVSIDSAANVTVDAGPASVDVGGGASVDPAQPVAIASDDPGTATGVGTVVADLDTELAANLNPGRAVVRIEVTVPAGPGNNDSATSLVPGPPPNAAADVSINTGGVDMDPGAATVDVDVSLDADLDEPTTVAVDTDSAEETNPPGREVDGLLNGLLRRPGRK